MRIAIIGGGISGLSVAVKVAEYYYDYANVQVKLFSDQVSPHTTADGSAGLWSPYLCGSTPVEKIHKWSKETHDFLHDMWKNGLAGELGICLQPMLRFTSKSGGYGKAPWSDIPFACKELTREQLAVYSREHGKQYTGGVQFISFTCEPSRLLPYLFKRFERAGGKFALRKIMDFSELENDFDVIINCTGLNAKYLANDDQMMPIRGQVARVSAPWQYQVILNDDDDGHYIIPNSESCVLGGTHQENDYNTEVDPRDSKFIFTGCEQIVPALKNAKLLKEWVGLRPGRSWVRLEKEERRKQNGAGIYTIIHNYGHGGSGVVFSWGCATDVLDIVRSCFEAKSKL